MVAMLEKHSLSAVYQIPRGNEVAPPLNFNVIIDGFLNHYCVRYLRCKVKNKLIKCNRLVIGVIYILTLINDKFSGVLFNGLKKLFFIINFQIIGA
jgi:hypothetical protein